jgi:hypothetical protein
MTDHIGENAALFALGALDAEERAVVESHVDSCDACARLLARAQDDVTTIASAQTPHAPPPELAARIAAIGSSDTVTELRALPQRRWNMPSWALGAVAAVVIGLLPTAYVVNQNIAMRQTIATEADAMARVSSSPHKTVAFTGAPGTDAHVMYAPDGSWYCVVVRGITRPLHLVWPHDGKQEVIGTAMPHGDVALVYLPSSRPMNELALMDDGTVVASAKLAFQ